MKKTTSIPSLINDNIISCKNISIKYKKNGSCVINDFSYNFKKGKIYAIIGPSGSGKTTLLSALSGLVKIANGYININGHIIDSKKKKIKNHKVIHKIVSMSFQFPESQIFCDTVEKELSFASKNFGIDEGKIKSSISRYLSLFNMDESILKLNPNSLSNGQKRLISIISILVSEPQVVILDEPTCGLDTIYQKQIINLIKLLKNEGKTIIFVSHNMNHVLELADTVLAINDKKLLNATEPYNLFLNKLLLDEIKMNKPNIINYITDNHLDDLLSFQPKTIDDLNKILKGEK